MRQHCKQSGLVSIFGALGFRVFECEAFAFRSAVVGCGVPGFRLWRLELITSFHPLPGTLNPES